MAKLVDTINKLTGADEATQKQKEQFAFLQKIVMAKCDQFHSELQKMALGEKSKSEIGGGRLFKYYSSQHIDIHSNPDERIEEAINSFFRGGNEDIKNGFKSLISTALYALINSSSIGEYQEDMFFIYPENNAIVRLDVKTYKYTFSSRGLVANCENIFCYTMAKSIIDHSTLKLDEIVYFVTDMSGAGGNIEIVEKFIEQLTEIWKKLRDKSSELAFMEYQIAHLQSELSENSLQHSVSLCNFSEIDEIADTDTLIDKALALGWDIIQDKNEKKKLVKKTMDTVYEIDIVDENDFINNSKKLLKLVALKGE